MADKEGTETAANDTSKDTEHEPTQEEQAEKLLADNKALLTRAEKAEGTAQGRLGSLQEKDRRLAEFEGQASLKAQVDYLTDAVKLFATQGLQMPESDLDVTPEKRTSINQVWAQMEEKHKQTQAADTVKAEQARYVQQAQGILQDAVDAGIAKDSEEYEDIYEFLVEGKVRNAERLIKKAKGAKPEDEKEQEQKWIDEGKRRAMEESGQLNSDTGGPQGSSARSFTKKQLEDMSPEDYIKNREAISVAQVAGRIK